MDTQTSSGLSQMDKTTPLTIIIHGLFKKGVAYGPSGHTVQLSIAANSPVSELWTQLTRLGYVEPGYLLTGSAAKIIRDQTKRSYKTYEEIEVVNGPSEIRKCININEPLIQYGNQAEPGIIDLNIGQSFTSSRIDRLEYDNDLEICFHRTVRMPDDGKLHQLPASLGTLPLYNVQSYPSLPPKMVQEGGVFLPLWQREALWISFSALRGKKYAVRVSVGGINAVTGKNIRDTRDEGTQDYITIPRQQWLDGICVDPGVVRQFVAMPLGSGYTVEGQKTGKEKYGGLQIEIIPTFRMGQNKWTRDNGYPSQADPVILYEEMTPGELGIPAGSKIRCYPEQPGTFHLLTIREMFETELSDGIVLKTDFSMQAKANYVVGATIPTVQTQSRDPRTFGLDSHDSRMFQSDQSDDVDTFPMYIDSTTANRQGVLRKETIAMGLAAGGKLVQDIYLDTNNPRIWNASAARIVNVHILDPKSCEMITHIVPPPPPMDAKEYTDKNLPFFVVEEQVDNRVDKGDFGNVMSVSEMDKQKGPTTDPSFDPLKPKVCRECQIRLCDCIIRPCDHQFCNVCIKKLEKSDDNDSPKTWKCPTCQTSVAHVAGFSAPMNLPGEESLKTRVSVHVLKVEDGRIEFKAIQRTRI